MPLVDIFVDVPFLFHLQESLLYPNLVRFICRTDKFVITDSEVIPKILERGRDLVGILLGCLSPLQCRVLDLLTVLICTGQKESLQATHSRVACECIGNDRCIGMADVGDIVDIVDRCGDIGFFARHDFS